MSDLFRRRLSSFGLLLERFVGFVVAVAFAALALSFSFSPFGTRIRSSFGLVAIKRGAGGGGGQATDGLWTEVCGQQKQSNDPGNNQHNPQYANYWAPLMRKRHTMPHSAQPQHTNYRAPRTRKRHQQEHRLQRPTESSDPTQHAKGRTGDRPGPRKGATRRNVTQRCSRLRLQFHRRTKRGST